MLRVSRATDYALRILTALCHAGGRRAKAADLAAATAVPEEYAVKVIGTLKRRGWVVSHRGAAGGYSLVAEAKDVTLLQIIEVFEGPVHLNACTQPNGCGFTKHCPAHQIWLEAERGLRSVLARYTIAELAARSQRRGSFMRGE